MTTATSPRLFVETIGDLTVASFADGEIVSEEVIHEVDEQLGELVQGLSSGDVLLNFRGVRLMSSTMLAVILKFSRRVTALRGGKVKLCCLDPSLREVFKITRFDRLFEIHEEEFLALDSF